MWKLGVDEFNAKRISRIKSHLRDGGDLWIGTDDADLRNTALAQQGELEHHRTSRTGCVLPAMATGEGDMGLIQQLNRGKQIYLPMNGEPNEGGLLTAKQYRFARMVSDIAVAEKDAAPGAPRQVMGVAEGSTWLGIIILYFAKVPGPLEVKAPMTFFTLSAMSRAAGTGVLAPAVMIIRETWIAIR